MSQERDEIRHLYPVLKALELDSSWSFSTKTLCPFETWETIFQNNRALKNIAVKTSTPKSHIRFRLIGANSFDHSNNVGRGIQIMKLLAGSNAELVTQNEL